MFLIWIVFSKGSKPEQLKAFSSKKKEDICIICVIEHKKT